jgi:co-chaperonin GroES (HSP10)
MHLLKHNKVAKAQPLVPIVSHWKVPGVRKMRGKRYNERGEYIGPCGPKKPVPDVAAQKAVRDAHEAAAKMPRPEEGGGFDLKRFKPLPNRVLVTRGEIIKELKGVLLPEDQWHSPQWYYCIRVGDGVDSCAVGDRIIFQRKHKPKPVKLGKGGFYIGRTTAIVGLVEA